MNTFSLIKLTLRLYIRDLSPRDTPKIATWEQLTALSILSNASIFDSNFVSSIISEHFSSISHRNLVIDVYFTILSESFQQNYLNCVYLTTNITGLFYLLCLVICSRLFTATLHSCHRFFHGSQKSAWFAINTSSVFPAKEWILPLARNRNLNQIELIESTPHRFIRFSLSMSSLSPLRSHPVRIRKLFFSYLSSGVV